jgi:CBS domain-containing protein
MLISMFALATSASIYPVFSAACRRRRALPSSVPTWVRRVRSQPFLKGDTPVREAAERMAGEDAGALPVCDTSGHLIGMVTDRDIVVKLVAEGGDPAAAKVGELTGDRSEVVTIGADDSIEEALRTMAEHQVRRLPVIDGTDMVGIVAQADLAKACPPEKVGELLEAISR